MTHPITYYFSYSCDDDAMTLIADTYGSQLGLLSTAQKKVLLTHLSMRLTNNEELLLGLPPTLSRAVEKLSDDGTLALLEATIAQLRTKH